jgi:hypothetical protein
MRRLFAIFVLAPFLFGEGKPSGPGPFTMRLKFPAG